MRCLLARDTVKRPSLVLDIGIEISPEFDKEKGSLWSLVVHFTEATLFLGEFVVYLLYVNRFEQWIGVGRGSSYVNEEMPLEL